MTQKEDGYYRIGINKRLYWHVIHNKKVDIMNQTARSNVSMKEALERILFEYDKMIEKANLDPETY